MRVRWARVGSVLAGGKQGPKRSAVCGQTALTKRSRDGRAKTKEFQSGVDRTGDFLKLGVKQTRGSQLGA